MIQSHAIESDTGFFAQLTVSEKLKSLLQFALLSPSNHNSQPWRFRVDESGVNIYADKAWCLPVADPENRELTISIGAVAARLSLAMRGHGMGAMISFVNDPLKPSLVARVMYTGKHQTTPLERMMMLEIGHRRAIQNADQDQHVESWMLGDLAEAAADRGCEIVWVGHGSLRLKLAEMVAEADRRMFSEKIYREELSRWIHDGSDGVPARLVRLAGLRSFFAPWIIRNINLGTKTAREDRAKAITAPALGILLSNGDAAENWLNAGEALSDMLIRANNAGLGCELFDQILELPGIREDLRRSMKTTKYPQAILRLAVAPEGKPLPRRPLESFVDETEGEPA